MIPRLSRNIIIPIMLLTMIIVLSYLIPAIRGGEKVQYELHFDRFLLPPRFEFPFGTDSLGRDLL